MHYCTITNNGSRPVNEDSIKVVEKDERFCFVLCDGLGGHGMGDVASNLVVNVFENIFMKSTDSKQFMESVFSASQDILIAKQAELNARSKMKTTAVAIATDEKNAYIGHIGDSRAYIFKRNKVKFQTLDHSIPQMLVLTKDIKKKEIRNHPDRNMLMKVMGIEWENQMFELQKPMPLRKCQAFLLCSDGFWELVDEDEMCDTLKQANSVEQWLNMMVSIVEQNGMNRNMDNYSAIAVWLD